MLIPPLAGGNEDLNFQRAAAIATGNFLIDPAPLPSGIVQMLQIANERFPEGSRPPYRYGLADLQTLRTLQLDREHPIIVKPSPIAVLSPIAYLPQVPLIALGIELGLPPLDIFYLGRLSGLVVAIALTFAAIKIMPIHRGLFAAMALLPPIVFSRSTFDADQFNDALAFLVLALITREILAVGKPPSWRQTVALAFAAFLLAQAKSAYLLLPMIAFAVPSSRFGLTRAQTFALFVLPGIVASVAWILVIQSSFHAAAYRTWSGIVLPEQQLQIVLSNPIHFGMVLVRTVFGTDFLPKATLEFLGQFGPPVNVPLAFFPILAMLIAAIGLTELPQPSPNRRAKILAGAIVVGTVGTILTFLYLQWTRVGASKVDGFQGRYLYPLVPLFLLMLPSGKMQKPRPEALVIAIGLVSAGSVLFTTWKTYWA